ncbi:MAG: SIS domain-containing protein, partial [Candidatus Omnitrophica bacterium]|nr:SIS domain-containing protein [Candidatus Omnitrophota bacterium]
MGQECAGTVEAIVNAVTESLNQGGKVLIFGNGGSAADSQHMAAELVGRFKKERNGLAAIALTANTSTISALANDYGYDRVFERQIEALGRKGDLAIGISTSGESKSIITALIKAKSLGLKTVAMTGA